LREIPMPEAHDFLAKTPPGAVLRTRDRREARIERIDAREGLLFGSVQMHGDCVWRADGRFRDAPFGAPGPLDLMSPDAARPVEPKTESMAEALASGENRGFCCD
jgi:hypothetical protein